MIAQQQQSKKKKNKSKSLINNNKNTKPLNWPYKHKTFYSMLLAINFLSTVLFSKRIEKKDKICREL